MIRRSLRWLLTPLVRWAWADDRAGWFLGRHEVNPEVVKFGFFAGPFFHVYDWTSTEARQVGKHCYTAAYAADELLPVFPENDDQ